MNEAKEEIRAKLAIEEVIGEYVSLKRTGRYWKGLSPFTNEKTPSFYVTPDKDIWHDFSSGKGGDLFSFIMEVEGLDFKGALEMLARKAGVDLTRYQTNGSSSLSAKKELFYQLNNLAINYFQHSLINNQTAISYAHNKRKLSKKTIHDWGIGYAPSKTNLKQLLLKKGYQLNDLKQVGLVNYRGNDLYRNRLMIPLRDRSGQVVGFTGRIISNEQPKYLNTPDTVLYHKGSQLFGLNFAIQAIRKANFAVLVEGNLDVISSHQAGVKNVVGVAGTALTIEHLKSLKRLCDEVRLCFDSDQAGVAATEKAIALAGSIDLKLTVIDFSSSGVKDPDELIQQDPKLWFQYLTNSQPAVNWVRDYYIKTIGLDSVDSKKTVVNKTLSVIGSLTDPVEKEGYIRELAQIVDISIKSLMDSLANYSKKSSGSRFLKKNKIQTININSISREDRFRYLDNILAYLGANIELRSKYLPLIDSNRLSKINLLIKKWLIDYDYWGDQLIDQVSQQMNSTTINLELYNQAVDKLAVLQLMADRANNSIEGIKSEYSLLDYFCHYEYNYYLKHYRQLTDQALASGLNDSKSVELSNKAKQAHKTALSLDPSTNRRQNYRGLRKFWQLQSIKTVP